MSRLVDLLRRVGDSLTKSDWLLFIPGIYALQLVGEVVTRIQYGFDYLFRPDFLAFYAGAKLLATDPSHLYSIPDQFRVEFPLVGPMLKSVRLFVNTPTVAFALEPLTKLPFPSALGVWFAFSCGVMAIAVLLLQNLLKTGLPWYTRVLIAIAAIGYAGTENLGLGTWGALQLLAILAAIYALRSGREFAAGVLLSFVMIKPQLGFFALPALLLGRHYRTAIGFCLGCVAWLVSSLLVAGVSGVENWLSILNAFYAQEGARADTLLSTLAFFGFRTGVLGEAILAVFALATMYAVRNRLRDATAAICFGLAVSYGVALVAHNWDTELLALPVILIARWNPGAGVIAALALGVSALIPHTSGPLIVIALVSLVAYWLREDHKSIAPEQAV